MPSGVVCGGMPGARSGMPSSVRGAVPPSKGPPAKPRGRGPPMGPRMRSRGRPRVVVKPMRGPVVVWVGVHYYYRSQTARE